MEGASSSSKDEVDTKGYRGVLILLGIFIFVMSIINITYYNSVLNQYNSQPTVPQDVGKGWARALFGINIALAVISGLIFVVQIYKLFNKGKKLGISEWFSKLWKKKPSDDATIAEAVNEVASVNNLSSEAAANILSVGATTTNANGLEAGTNAADAEGVKSGLAPGEGAKAFLKAMSPARLAAFAKEKSNSFYNWVKSYKMSKGMSESDAGKEAGIASELGTKSPWYKFWEEDQLGYCGAPAPKNEANEKILKGCVDEIKRIRTAEYDGLTREQKQKQTTVNGLCGIETEDTFFQACAVAIEGTEKSAVVGGEIGTLGPSDLYCGAPIPANKLELKANRDKIALIKRYEKTLGIDCDSVSNNKDLFERYYAASVEAAKGNLDIARRFVIKSANMRKPEFPSS